MSTESNIDLKEYVFKIVVLGDAAVGKTSLINQYIEKSFKEDYKPTLGANIIRKDVTMPNIKAKVRLILWDLAGQEKYNVIRSMYFQGCVGAMLVFDLTRLSTFEAIESKWLKDFIKYVKKEGSYILIGNKSDLKDQRAISVDDGKKYADTIKACEYVETSAKHNENVEKGFITLVREILKRHGELI